MSSIYLSEGVGLGNAEIVSIFAIAGLLNLIATITVGIYRDRMRSKKRLAMIAALICMARLLLYMRAESNK